MESVDPQTDQEPRPRVAVAEAPGVYGVIQYRDWCQEYRIRTEAITGGAPPAQGGPRESKGLTERAAMKLAESSRYVAQCHGGFRTFVTLTFDAVSRAALNRRQTTRCKCAAPWSIYPRPRAVIDGEPNPLRDPQEPHKDALPRTTVQRHVSRFFDGARKMHSRGWMTAAGRRIPGAKHDLLYAWVAENPENAQGERNPHVHVLMNWRVPRWLFDDWSKRLEGLWREGFAHLEKIRDERAASGYMLKALGYMAKGAGDDSDQGPIRGNRYAISNGAQAPAWVTIERRELRALGALIADVNEHITATYAERNREFYRAKEYRETVADANKALRSQGRELSKERQRLAEKARRRMEKARRERQGRPVMASRYQLIVRGKTAYREVRAWLGAGHHWPGRVVEYLPEKPAGEYWHRTKAPPPADVVRMRDAIQWRAICRTAERRRWSDDEWSASVDDYETYAAMNAENGGDDGSNESWAY